MLKDVKGYEGNQMKKAFDMSLLTLDELVKSSILIESIKNQKKR